MKRYCLKVLAVSFSKNQLSLFCCSYFLFSYLLSLSQSLLFFLFSHYLTLVSNYFYLSLLSILILLLLYLFSFLLFISYFKFIFVPFSSFVFPFLPFFFPFVRQTSPSCASSACHYIQYYPYWPFKNSPRRTPRQSKLSAKLKCLFPLLLYYCSSRAAWTILYSISLHPPILNSLNGLSFPEPQEGLRYTHF